MPLNLARKIKREISNFVFYDVVHRQAQVNEMPVFILGNPKSGTTAIARLLANATGETLTPDFLRAIPRADLQPKLVSGTLGFDAFIRQYRYEFSNTLIKEPFLSFFTAQLMEYFPNAQYIFIARDPYQNIRSILNRLNIPGNLDQLNSADYPALETTPVWKLAFNSEIFGYECSHYIEGMAQRWDYAVQQYKAFEDRIHLYKYEDFVKDKSGMIKDIAATLGLEYKHDIAGEVDVQYQSKGNSSVEPREFFGNDNYDIIKKATAESAKFLGYT